MVYLCTNLIAALGAVVQTTRVGTAWSKISGLQPELVYLARAQVIVGSNPTRPTINLNEREDQEHRLQRQEELATMAQGQSQ